MIYIRNANAYTKTEDIINWMKELGIKNFKISECFLIGRDDSKKECDCSKFQINDGDLEIHLGKIDLNLDKKFIRVFTKKKLINLEGAYSHYGYYLEGEKDVIINVGNCVESKIDILSVLKHELLHIEKFGGKEKHCNFKDCFFSRNKNVDKNFFCNTCKEKLKKIVKNINKK